MLAACVVVVASEWLVAVTALAVIAELVAALCGVMKAQAMIMWMICPTQMGCE